MPYAHTTFASIKDELANRLQDSANVHWADVELGLYINEALRTFGILSGFWRERATFPTANGTAFYALQTELAAIAGFTVTDRNLVQMIQYHLLESAASQAAWQGTEMFTLADVGKAIERRRNQFLSDTGIVLTRSTVAVPAPPGSGRVPLTDTTVDVRRAAWRDPDARYYPLWRSDEYAETAANTGWSVNPSTPESYSIMAPPPLMMQLAPPPNDAGDLEIISVQTGAALDPAAGATVLGIPDDLAWVVKWGALADLLGEEGQAFDPQRAEFCEQRYGQGVELARMVPFVVHCQLNGRPLQTSTMFEIDAASPQWQNRPGTPQDVALVGFNMAAIAPMPDGIYSVTMDVVRRAPVLSDDGDQLQVGREQLDMLLDYAEHLAAFKLGGPEFQGTVRNANNFLVQSMTYNQRLSASARYIIEPRAASQKEKQERPRRLARTGLGALPAAVATA